MTSANERSRGARAGGALPDEGEAQHINSKCTGVLGSSQTRGGHCALVARLETGRDQRVCDSGGAMKLSERIRLMMERRESACCGLSPLTGFMLEQWAEEAERMEQDLEIAADTGKMQEIAAEWDAVSGDGL